VVGRSLLNGPRELRRAREVDGISGEEGGIVERGRVGAGGRRGQQAALTRTWALEHNPDPGSAACATREAWLEHKIQLVRLGCRRP
jgi:hypothetical protein